VSRLQEARTWKHDKRENKGRKRRLARLASLNRRTLIHRAYPAPMTLYFALRVLLLTLLAACALSPRPAEACGGAVAAVATNSSSDKTKTTPTKATTPKNANSTATASKRKAATKKKKATSTVIHVGYLVDMLCWNRPGHVAIDGAALRTAPQDHTVHCLRDIPACRAGGFGLLEKVEEKVPATTVDANNTATATAQEEPPEPPPLPGFVLKYRLDAAGNALALELLDASAKEKDYVVRVTGTVLPSEEEEEEE
jgi:hypothetical protein